MSVELLDRSTNVIRLAIGFPAYGGQLSAHHARMWLELGSCLGASTNRFQLVAFDFVDLNPVDRARNFLLARAFQASADWLLMIDADTWVEGRLDADAGFQLCRMISEADHIEVAIVMAPVIARVADSPRRLPMIYRLGARDHDGLNDLSRAGLRPIDLGSESHGLVIVDAGATAVMAINLHKIGESRFSFADGLGEDLNFCRQVGMLNPNGIRCDTRVYTGHTSRSFPLYNK